MSVGPPGAWWGAVGALVFILGSCAVWTGTADGRLAREIAQAVDEGADGVRGRQEDNVKHSYSLVREIGPTADVPDRYDIEVIGEARQVGVSEPKLFAWMERRAEDTDRVLNAGVLRLTERFGEMIVLTYYPYRGRADVPAERDLESVLQLGGRLPSDVEAFARRKIQALR